MKAICTWNGAITCHWFCSLVRSGDDGRVLEDGRMEEDGTCSCRSPSPSCSRCRLPCPVLSRPVPSRPALPGPGPGPGPAPSIPAGRLASPDLACRSRSVRPISAARWLAACWQPCRLANWLADWLADWLANWLANWLAGWLADWLAGWLSGWLAGWHQLVGGLASQCKPVLSAQSPVRPVHSPVPSLSLTSQPFAGRKLCQPYSRRTLVTDGTDAWQQHHVPEGYFCGQSQPANRTLNQSDHDSSMLPAPQRFP